MKKIGILLFAMLWLMMLQLDAKDQQDKPEIISLGFGLGMDYGGYGGNILVYPQKNIGLFAGMGYAIAGAGFNCGAKLRFISDKHASRVNAYLIGMYGYNAAIAVSNATGYDKLFYGPTFGFGFDLHPRYNKRGYWSFALLIPVRSPDVNNYMNELKNNDGVSFSNGLSPVGFSVGYRIILN